MNGPQSGAPRYCRGDFETFSVVDLKRTGVDVYADDASTGVWCFAWAIGDEPVELWTPDEPSGIQRLFDYIADGGVFCAHNAAFEWAIWNRTMTRLHGWPALPIDSVEDTMAMCYAMALPGSLSGAAQALSLPIDKDKSGQSLMLRMARPRRIDPDGTPVWWNLPDRLEKLYAYCKQDVEVERMLHGRLLRLPEYERQLWRLDHQINQRGVPLDIKSVKNAITVATNANKELNLELQKLSRGRLTSASAISQLTGWIELRLEQEGVTLPNGLHSLDKASVADLLSINELPADVRRALEIRQRVGRTSIKKLQAMEASASSDGRARGLHQYHGAATGRWAGRRIQPQNLPRPKLDDADIDLFFHYVNFHKSQPRIKLIEAALGDVQDVVADALRGFIKADPGMALLCADFANIEGRVLAWLAGQEDKLDAFRAYDNGAGPDLYKVAAAGIYTKEVEDVDKDERQIGKVAELALGYGGGVGAFGQMAGAYGVTVEDDAAVEIKNAWRKANPRIVRFWAALERAAMSAVGKPGKMYRAGPIRFIVSGSLLLAQLPSKRCLSYPYPKLAKREMPWGGTRLALTYRGVDTFTRKWGMTTSYGGKLCENVTQAVARDVLADAMVRLTNRDYKIVMHVHDEIVAECDARAAEGLLPDFMKTMSENPAWAEGLPISVDGWTGERYRK